MPSSTGTGYGMGVTLAAARVRTTRAIKADISAGTHGEFCRPVSDVKRSQQASWTQLAGALNRLIQSRYLLHMNFRSDDRIEEGDCRI